MFSGIVEKVAKVSNIEKTEKQSKILIASGFRDLVLGESVAVNGVCLTVSEFTDQGDALFYVSPETLSCTNFANLEQDAHVNLERALRVSDRLSGHIVQGHVDTEATITLLEKEAEAFLLKLEIAQEWQAYCISKGSITLNGVSLTINHMEAKNQDSFEVTIQIIPHTMEHTNFAYLQTGDKVNVEVDVLAKYMEGLCQKYLKQ